MTFCMKSTISSQRSLVVSRLSKQLYGEIGIRKSREPLISRDFSFSLQDLLPNIDDEIVKASATDLLYIVEQ